MPPPFTIYSDKELERLYPKGLELQHVQVFLRHGERTPAFSIFPKILPEYWQLCDTTRLLTSSILTLNGGPSVVQRDTLQWRRFFETFSPHKDQAMLVVDPKSGDPTGFCAPGELTDVGRANTFHLGNRLRMLYVKQLGFLPPTIADARHFHFRSSAMTRATESLQQVFAGMYPRETRDDEFPAINIVVRKPADEVIYPNESNCKRFTELLDGSTARMGIEWEGSEEQAYVHSLLGKHLLPGQKVSVDGTKPTVHDVIDAIDCTREQGASVRLPPEFYDERLNKVLSHADTMHVLGPFATSREFRRLGSGGILSNVVARMVANAQAGSLLPPERAAGMRPTQRFDINGSHDSTLGGMLVTLGHDLKHWPGFSEHLVYELFRKTDQSVQPPVRTSRLGMLWRGEWGDGKEKALLEDIGKTPLAELHKGQKQQLQGFYVRLRFNDKVVNIPGCKPQGKHLEGDESFCTLTAFKEIVDEMTPKDWRRECLMNLGEPAHPSQSEPPAGC